MTDLSSAQWIETREDAVTLAQWIMSMRDRPLVVLSTDPATDELAVDVEDVRSGVGDLADVVVIRTGRATWALDQHLPDRTQVYGGAGRSYPVDFGSDPDWSRAPLRFPGPRAVGLLVGDAIAQASRGGVFQRRAADDQIPASGRVRGFVESRAIVDVDGHRMATISDELLYPLYPLEWMLSVGQQVTGVLDVASRRLLLPHRAPSTAELMDAFPHRGVTLALVARVAGDQATVLLHPDAAFRLRREDVSVNPLDTLDLLLAEGDVVLVRVLHLSDGSIHLTMLDVDDDDEVVPALALVDGGPPWLVEGRALLHDDLGAESDAVPVSAPHARSAPRPEVVPVAEPDAVGKQAGEGFGAEVPDVGALSAENDVGAAGAEAHAGALPAEADVGVAGVEEVDVGARAAESDADAADEARHPLPGPGMHLAPPVADGGDADSTTATAGRGEGPGGAPDGTPDARKTSAAGSRAALRSTQLALHAARAEIARLERQLARTGIDDSTMERLRAEVRGVRAQLSQERAERGELERKLRELREQRRGSTQALREARKVAQRDPAVRESREDRRARWLSGDEWVRHEIYLAWVERVSASDREGWPLADYAVGDRFAASLEQLDDQQFAKALRACVDAITGRIREVASREAHPLRAGDGGDDPDVVRLADGAKCWRAYIEQNTPAARRLHYWVLPGGGIELGRIVVHDDTEP
nr:hypothetical protein [Microbacterium bovistercoris]